VARSASLGSCFVLPRGRAGIQSHNQQVEVLTKRLEGLKRAAFENPRNSRNCGSLNARSSLYRTVPKDAGARAYGRDSG